MARTSTANTAALQIVTHPVITLRDQREGEFEFPKAEAALAPSGGVIVGGEAVVQAAPAPAARVSRERFDADDALISFIQANQWSDLKTQKILDSLRAKGHACGMSRLNKLLGRDSKGNALPAAEPAKA